MSLGIDCCNCLRRIRLCGRLFSQSVAASRSGFYLDGVYAGGQVGYAWGNDKPTWVVKSPFIDFTETFNDSPQGVIGGAHVGYNQQFDKWVIGVEGSVDGTSLSKTVVAPLVGFGGAYTVAVTSQSSLQGSIRARVGIGWEPILLYGTGGVAFAGIQNDFVDTVGTFTGIPGSTASFSNTRVGWTAGGGLEYAHQQLDAARGIPLFPIRQSLLLSLSH